MSENELGGEKASSPEQTGAPTAPIGKTGESPSVGVEQAGSRHGDSQSSGLDRGGHNAFQANLRAQKRIEDRIARIEDAVNRFASSRTAPSPSLGASERKTFWESPEEALSSMLDARDQKLLETLNQQRQALEAQSTYQRQLNVADDYLAKLGEFTDQDKEELKEMAVEYGIGQLALRDPQKAANILYSLWAQEHGINPLQSKGRNIAARPSKVQASGVRGTAPGTGPRNWTAEEIAKLSGTPKYREYRDQIRESIAQIAAKGE